MEPEDEVKEEHSHLPQAKSVLGCDEIEHFKELGLGRAVDASNPFPWLNKSSFQVRNVTPDCIIGTEEGGFLQSFVHEVYSVDKLHAKLNASISDGGKVKVGVDAEMSRKSSTSMKTAGKKIVTRSIFFKPDFSVTHLYNITASQEGEELIAMPCTGDFEWQLVMWVLENLVDEFESQSDHESSAKESEKDESNPEPKSKSEGEDDVLAQLITSAVLSTDKKAKILQSKCQEITKEWPSLEKTSYVQKKCLEFVQNFHVTHYVSGISLGAEQYKVWSEKDYQQEITAKGTLQVMQFGSASAEVQKTLSFSKTVSGISYIGRFSGDKVERGTTDEAVVEAELEPVSSLVKFKLLKELLQQALRTYIDNQESGR